MSKIIGIDLGTTNSCLAIYENGKYKIIPNQEGKNTTPSVIGYNKGEQLVGEIAKRQAITNPEKTFYAIKRLVGRKYDSPEVQEFIKTAPFKIIKHSNGDAWVELDGKPISPEQLGAAVLTKLKKAAEDYLGHPVTDAVITCPAYFQNPARETVKAAGKIAGLNVKRVINEPTAAALAYGADQNITKTTNVLVVDFGGGTLDFTVLEISDDGVFEVKATNGDNFLGGHNLDEKIIDHILEKFQETEGIDLRKDSTAMQRIQEAAEKAKHELSSTTTTDINVPFIIADESGPKHLNMNLTRATFESLIADTLKRMDNPFKTCLSDSGLSMHEIDEVLLVGGSTRVPAVQEKVKSLSGGKEPSKGVNPDEVVAAGAAVQAGIMQGDVTDVLLLDVTPLSLGIETMGGVMTKIIEKNTTIPTKKSQVFSTAQDNQPAVSVHVLQGEREFAKDNKSLGNFDLTGINPAPRGVPQIEVTFDIDANGIIEVSAKDKATGKATDIKISGGSGLTDAEIERMVQEAEANASADKEKREVVDMKNNLESLVASTERMVKDTEGLSEEDKTEVMSALEKARNITDSANKETIETAYNELQKSVHELSTKLYAEQQSNPSTEENTESSSDTKIDSKDDDVVDAEFKEV